MSHCFHIVAIADPQTLSRVVGLFAQRSLVPHRLSSRRVANRLHILLEVGGLDSTSAETIAARLVETVLVAKVVCERRLQREAGICAVRPMQAA